MSNSIERQDVPTADIDWSKAPKGATHCDEYGGFYYKAYNSTWHKYNAGDGWASMHEDDTAELSATLNKIQSKRPESITDVARSIEAARIEEQARMPFPDGDARYFETSDCLAVKISDDQPAAQVIDPPVLGNQGGRAYPHYFKDVSAVDAIDLYHVARLYDITDPALFHAFKKIACAGKRGAKDQAQDVQEAIDTLKRWQELSV